VTDRVAILFDRLGPYHVARIEAASRRFDVIAIETSERTSDYAWDPVEGSSTFQRRTLFSAREGDSRSIRARKIEDRVQASLDEAGAAAVFVPGWSTAAALAALAWCLRNDRPAIVMSESTASDDQRHWYKEGVKRYVVPLFSAGLVGGKLQREYLHSLGMANSVIFEGYDAVDNHYFRSGSQTARADSLNVRQRLQLPERYFLASARFIEKKNIERLLYGYALFRDTVGTNRWKLVLLGDGPLRGKVEALRAQLSLEADVSLPGFIQYDSLPKYYGLASAFVHASTSEQWGLVVNEAMASSLPVLVSERCGCTPDLVRQGKNGYTFNPFETNSIAARLVEVSRLSDERLSEMGGASSRIIDQFDVEYFGEGAKQAYHAACAGTRSRTSWGARLIPKVLLAGL
jgi:1,2-diacylglycerol 3-alpha-glucosyltransferase